MAAFPLDPSPTLIVRRGFIRRRFLVIFAHRMIFKTVPHQKASQIWVSIEDDSIEIVDFALEILPAPS
jgi:hypothetical protein